jgi:phenylalanyl-tRNA synthetase alpha subunit
METFEILDLIKELRDSFTQDMQSPDFDWDIVYVKYLGKKGVINQEFQKAKNLTDHTKIEFLKEINKFKAEIESALEKSKPTGYKTQVAANSAGDSSHGLSCHSLGTNGVRP